MKSYPDKKVFFSLLAITLIAVFLGPRIASNNPSAPTQTASVIDAIKIPPRITLGFVGDIMLDRGVAASVKKNFNGDYAKMFAQADFLHTPDIIFANLEGPVSETGTKEGSIYSFRMSPSVLPALKASGIDIVSFANNHVGDYGHAAFEDTITRVRGAGILTCGAGWNKAEAATPAIVEQDGYRVGYLCFSDVGPGFMRATATASGILLADDPDFATIIQNARAQVNTLIVSFHWGEEYKTTHTSRQEELAKRAIDNGASMVVGHHPHVAEDTDVYNHAPIVYSLGNFIFDQPFSKETMEGMFATATIQDPMITDFKTQAIHIDSHFVPAIK